MKCFDSTIFELSWSKCIKCTDERVSPSIVGPFTSAISSHPLQVDQKCINFIFMAINTAKKRLADVFILHRTRLSILLHVSALCLLARSLSYHRIFTMKIFFLSSNNEIFFLFSLFLQHELFQRCEIIYLKRITRRLIFWSCLQSKNWKRERSARFWVYR